MFLLISNLRVRNEIHEFARSSATGCGGHPSSTNLGEHMTFVERRPYGGNVWRSSIAAHHPQIKGERMKFEERRPPEFVRVRRF